MEDHDDTRSLYTELLTSVGYEVDAHATGEEAVKHVLRRVPAALLLDIGLPGEDGLSICRRLRAHPRAGSLPIIAISAWLGANEPHYRPIGDASFTELIPKPVAPMELLEVVRRWAPLPSSS